MKLVTKKSVVISLSISVLVAVAISFLWKFGGSLVAAFANLVSPQTTEYSLTSFLLLIFLSLAVGISTEIYGLKRNLFAVGGFLFVWFCLSLFAKFFLETNLFFIPVLLTVSITLITIHLKKLWAIDAELTEKLVALASTGHLLEGKSADSRLEDGLKLLETVLPLSEVIVFRYTLTGKLNPIGRANSGKKENTSDQRQSSWRENIGLCEESFELRQTIVKNDDTKKGAARVALPLIYEDVIIGVLFVKINEKFERGDQNLLEAFAGQLAHNFQRRELRSKSLPHNGLRSSFSTFSAENRLDIISLIHGIIKEQSFSATAGSYLNEAHAVAYLDGTLAYMNRQMEELAKFDSVNLRKINLFKLLERFKTEAFSEPNLSIRRVLQTGESYKNELYFPESNKTLMMQISLIKVSTNPDSTLLSQTQAKPACFLVTFTDVSAVRENKNLRSDLAALMSHELRTPITSIKGFAEIMLMEDDLQDDFKEYLTVISNESQRLSKILTTFLTVSKLEQTDKKEFTKSAVKLNEVVEEIVKDFQPTAKSKRIRLVGQSTKELPPISADRGLLARAISNLVDNAIRYSPERTSVIISTLLEADFLRVVVEDRGYGIHSREHEKIWEKFYRVPREGQDKEEDSTGLGLSLVKEIAEQHGGDVTVESEVGQGSKFSISLPRF